jgi:hypothetical protein
MNHGSSVHDVASRLIVVSAGALVDWQREIPGRAVVSSSQMAVIDWPYRTRVCRNVRRQTDGRSSTGIGWQRGCGCRHPA